MPFALSNRNTAIGSVLAVSTVLFGTVGAGILNLVNFSSTPTSLSISTAELNNILGFLLATVVLAIIMGAVNLSVLNLFRRWD